jgi:hypothetical protein
LRCVMQAPMMTSDSHASAVLTSGEREYIRRELDLYFGTLPSVAEGFQLRTWRGAQGKASRSCRRQPRAWLAAASCTSMRRAIFPGTSSPMLE